MKHRRILILSVLVVALFVGGCSLSVWQAKRQYALNNELIAALVHNDTRQALALVNVGADPKTRYTPSPVPTLKLLLYQLSHCLSPTANDSPTALMLACGKCWVRNAGEFSALPTCGENLPLLQAMLAHGANVHACTGDKWTALHAAIAEKRWRATELLLKQGAKVNAQDTDGVTPLMEVCSDADTPTGARLLLRYGANPNIQNKDGRTALFYAIIWPPANCIVADLVAQGANPNLKDKRGKTPLQYAQPELSANILALLQRGGK